MVRAPVFPGISPEWPKVAIPFRDKETATKSRGDGGSGTPVSHTVTYSLSTIGSAPQVIAAKPDASTHIAVFSMPPSWHRLRESTTRVYSLPPPPTCLLG